MRGRQPHPGREKMDHLGRLADGVSSLILRSDYPDIDVVVAVSNFRERALNMYPDREGLLEMIYISRFRRLWDQFRESGRAPF